MRSASNDFRWIGATLHLLGTAAVVFSLIRLPGDPVVPMLGEGAAPADAAWRAKS